MAERKTDAFKEVPLPSLVPASKVGASGADPRLMIKAEALRDVSRVLDKVARGEKAERIARGKALSQALSDTINLEVEREIFLFGKTTPLNPGAIQEAGEQLIQEQAQSIPEIGRPAFIAKHRLSVNKETAVANSRVIKLEQEKAAANSKILAAQENAFLVENAKNRFSIEPALRKSSEEKVESIFNAQMARMRETFTDYFGNEVPLFTAKQQADQFNQSRDAALMSGLFQAFLSSPNKPIALREFDRGDVRFGIPELKDPKDPRKVKNIEEGSLIDVREILGESWSGFRTRMSQLITSEKNVRGAQERAEEKLAATGRTENYKESLLSLDPSNTELVPVTRLSVLESPPGTYNAGDREKLLTAIDKFETTTKADDDEDWVFIMQTELANDRRIDALLREVAANEDVIISQETYFILLGLDADLADKLAGVTAGLVKSSLSHQRSMLGDAYDPVGRFGSIDRDQSRKRNQAWDAYDQTVLDARERGLEGRELMDFARETRLELELRVPDPRAKDILPKLPRGMTGATETTTETLALGLSKLEKLNRRGVVVGEQYRDAIMEYDRLLTKAKRDEERARLNASGSTGRSKGLVPERRKKRGQ